MKKLILSTIILIVSIGCVEQDQTAVKQIEPPFNASSLESTIQERGKIWSTALTTKNVALLEGLYAENVHYLPDGEVALNGREEVVDYWKTSMDFIHDIQLTMESLEGTKELLYETGTGIALIPNAAKTIDTINYKYVNVWKLQKNGSYQVVIDTFNDLPRP